MENTGKKQQEAEPMQKKTDVQTTNDEHIDQDYPGFPNLPAKENIINPKSEEDRATAGIDAPKKNE